MRLQSQILQTLRAPEAQARLGHIVAHGACESRAALGREVCAQFGFVDARGSAQLTGCLTALKVLESAGQLTLPAPRPHPQRPSPRCLDAPVPAPVEVPAQVRDVEGLRLVVVEDEAQRRVWNTLLATEHPQGTTTFVGCQLRYLIGSAHGWLGAVGFSASALRLRARDTWMGWSDEQRTAHLHRVVCLSRFLIRPAVQCRHLASHVLGRVLRRVEADFEVRYRYRPWLVETFVAPAHEGASFRAANRVRDTSSDGLAGRIAEVSRRQELRDPDEDLGRLDRAVNRVAEIAGIAALGTIVLTVFANAVGRYAFNSSIIWAEELVLLLVPWLAMTGVFLSVRRGTMIRIDYFFEKLPRVLRRPLGPLGHLFSACVLTFMAGISVQFVLLFGSDRALYLEIPRSYSSSALVVGGFASALAFVAVLVRERRGSRREVPGDER